MSDTNDTFEKLMSAQLSRTIDFVKFAETKNAALLTFSSAWIIGAINLLTGQALLPLGYDVAFSVALPLFAAGGLTCILSFAPQVLAKFHETQDDEAKSLLYWGHIADLPAASYTARVTARYKPEADHSMTERYLDDLCIQVSVNAKIAKRKFSLFNVAAGFIFAAIFILLLPPLWWAIQRMTALAQ